MRADITMIRSYYGSRGYADVLVTPDIRDAGPNRVSITYRITEGSRFRVGRVNIAGNTKTKDKVIRREIPLKPGDMFNSVELETTKARLENLQYFSDVQATGSPGGSGYRDVNVLVEEKADRFRRRRRGLQLDRQHRRIPHAGADRTSTCSTRGTSPVAASVSR